jgi:hypothetical protein
VAGWAVSGSPCSAECASGQAMCGCVDLLAIAAALHCAWTGSCDGLPDAERDRLLAIVRARLANWRETTWPAVRDYDEAVRALLMAVVAEYDREMR